MCKFYSSIRCAIPACQRSIEYYWHLYYNAVTFFKLTTHICKLHNLFFSSNINKIVNKENVSLDKQVTTFNHNPALTLYLLQIRLHLFSYLCEHFSGCCYNQLRKGKALRKHSLHKTKKSFYTCIPFAHYRFFDILINIYLHVQCSCFKVNKYNNNNIANYC